MSNIPKAKEKATAAMVKLHCIDYSSDVNFTQQSIKDARRDLQAALEALNEVVK